MKEIKVKYENGNDLTWKAWDYTIEDGKMIYSAARDNSINIIKLDEITTIEVDNEIIYDKYMDSFKKQLNVYLKFCHNDRIADVDVWHDENFYFATVIEVSKNHVVYRYRYHADSSDDIFKVKSDGVEVFQ